MTKVIVSMPNGTQNLLVISTFLEKPKHVAMNVIHMDRIGYLAKANLPIFET